MSQTVIVDRSAAYSIVRGHPWVYRDKILNSTKAFASIQSGDSVQLVDSKHEFLGHAMIDTASPIAARVWSQTIHEKISSELIYHRIQQAIALRETFLDSSTTAYRWVHGEGDRAPGIVVDRYNTIAVLKLDGHALEVWLEPIANIVFEIGQKYGIRSVVVRSSHAAKQEKKLRLMHGAPISEQIVVYEHGVPFVVDLIHGQKTGAFLDQRDNRARVQKLARDRTVLNLFSYAGGFSMHAILGGAKHCTSVDIASGAHATAQRSFRQAGIDPAKHSFVTADVWQYLKQAQANKKTWDLIISDPPNMAPNEASRSNALSAYRHLHKLCASVLNKGGIVCASSCSSHITLEDFFSTFDDASLGRADLRVLEVRGAGADHPVLPAFPEGRYLKFCVLN